LIVVIMMIGAAVRAKMTGNRPEIKTLSRTGSFDWVFMMGSLDHQAGTRAGHERNDGSDV
jgi:hypothetical protein